MTARLGFAREATILVFLAVAGAIVSNALAPRERQLAWFGRPPISDAPSAISPRRGRSPAPSTAVPAPAASTAIAPSPVPRAPAPPAAASPSTTPTAAPDFSPHPGRPWAEITSEQAKTLFDRGAVFFDARRSSVFREGHIRGARSISVWEADADEKVKAFLDEGRDPNAPIVVYCSGGDCEDSHELAQKLWGVTFDNVYVYRDGFPDWEKRRWPVARGDLP